jgi:hypothetical protein
MLKKAVKISEYSQDKSGKPLKVLSEEHQKIFGDFDGKISIQRCSPRWVFDNYIDSTKKYITTLE